MSKNLVIVESPAKAKTIEGYLGKDFKVESSYGHVRDLPSGDKAIDIENGFAPTYEVTKDKKEVVKNLKADVARTDKQTTPLLLGENTLHFQQPCRELLIGILLGVTIQ